MAQPHVSKDLPRPSLDSSTRNRFLGNFSLARRAGDGLAVVFVWAVLYIPRIFVLGFYGDDWFCFVGTTQSTQPFSPARFLSFIGFSTFCAPRPVLGLTEFLFSSIFGTSAWVA